MSSISAQLARAVERPLADRIRTLKISISDKSGLYGQGINDACAVILGWIEEEAR